jgi:hypothetical protein
MYMDAFITPTFAAGFDFGYFPLGAQVSYTRGVISAVNGVTFSIGVGIHAGSFR